jgi:hypothetical protein|tara:strand:+ start:1530 stop:1964 length:435 start_codon:yes stop_codon:yes gene_type:complete
MYKVVLSLVLLIFSTLSFADHHSLSLEARQPRTELELTSITLGGDVTTINAEAQMGVYGRVYMTFILSRNDAGTGGTYTFEGRGYVDEETVFSGTGVGVWNRVADGSNFVMEQLINISDGTINFDRIVMDPLNRTATLDVYAVK